MNFKKLRTFIFKEIFPIVVIAIFVDFIVYYAVLGYIFLYKPVLTPLNIFCTVFFVFLAGGMLFLFKCKYPKWYGGLEIFLAGINVVTFLLAESPEDEKAYATLFSHLATLYIIVRGLDNCFSRELVLRYFSIEKNERTVIPDFAKSMSNKERNIFIGKKL